MQAVSANWAANITAAVRNVVYGIQMSWPQTIVSSSFFTINVSHIGGADIIKSGGSAPAFFDKYQYTDYSQYLISMSVSQKIGQFPYGTIMAQASAQLDNGNYLFTPGFDGTIGAYILPNRPLRLSLGFNGESLQQFIGFTDTPVLDREELTCNLTAFDALNYISTYKSATTAVQVNQRADQIIATGLAEMGFSSTQYSLDQSLMSPIGALAPYGLRWGDIFQQLCEAEQALLFVDENGIIQFWNRQHFLSHQTVLGTLDYTNLENLQGEATPIFNDVIVKANPRTVVAKQKVWELGTPIIVSGSLTYEIDFSDSDGSLPVTTADTPTANNTTSSSFTGNSLSDGTGTDTTGNLSITSLTLKGTTATIVIANSSGPSYLTALSIFGTPAIVTDRISIRVTDSTSVNAYGVNPGNNGDVLEIDNDYIQDRGNSNSLATTIVAEYKDPRGRYLAYPYANPAVQIGDYFTVTDGDSGVTKNMWVTGRTVTLGAGELSQVLELEERGIQSYFQINVSLINGTDKIAP